MWGNPLDDISHACTHQLLFCREIVRVINNEWANHVASIPGLNLPSVQPGSIGTVPLCEQFYKTMLPLKTTNESMLRTYLTSVRKLVSA
jgi:hypothetical protein